MKGKITNEYGEILIDLDVISQYAGTAAMECSGIVGMAAVNMTDGLVRLLKRESLNKGVSVEIVNNELQINYHVVVAYGVNISTVASNLVSNVRYKIEQFTGMKVGKIRVFVEGVRVID
ncbi:MAG: Asp23/Gls24 family envelope stress response protein [Lachnospiraceae bacterium]|nr:Asp23/Gls24 family envelope stress response protein [Lachnospiraceae bacterium]